MKNDHPERRTVEILAGLYLDDLLHDKPDDWDGIVGLWYDGLPEELGFRALDHDHDMVRTIFACCTYGDPPIPWGYERVDSCGLPDEISVTDDVDNPDGYVSSPGWVAIVVRRVEEPTRWKIGEPHGQRWHEVSAVPVRCPYAGQYGALAYPGDLVLVGDGGGRLARVLGRITECARQEGDTKDYVGFLSILELAPGATTAYGRWCHPAEVKAITPRASANEFARWFITPGFPVDPDAILQASKYGTLSENYIADPKCGPANLRGRLGRFIPEERSDATKELQSLATWMLAQYETHPDDTIDPWEVTQRLEEALTRCGLKWISETT